MLKAKSSSILTNNHLNTILPIYLAQSLNPNYSRERLRTPDKDFLDLDWVNINVTDKPTVVLFHGTEGSSKSHYARRLMCYLEQLGWRGVVPHFRSCSDEINLTTKFYHAGDTKDVNWILHQIKQRTSMQLFAAGVSLGGNTLLKYLGEANPNIVDAAVAISVPFDLAECTHALDENPFNRIVYVKHFLNSLLPKMKDYANRFDDFPYTESKVDTLNEFNSLYTCPIFNFKSPDEYYANSSCKPFLKSITTPTLILQAKNDPMIPVSCWPNKNELSQYIKFVATSNGGHAGFLSMSRNYKDSLLRMPKFIVSFLEQFRKETHKYKDGNLIINEIIEDNNIDIIAI